MIKFLLGALTAMACAMAQQGTAQPGSDRPSAALPEAAPTQLYMIRYRPGPNYLPGVPLLRQDLRDHGRYMQSLVQQGVIVAAGPTMAQAGGLVLLRARSLNEAQAIMTADPAVRAGIFVGELSDWSPVFDPGTRFDVSGAVPPR